MTFPVIPTVAAGRVLTINQADTTATRTFPALSGLTKNAGDRLIAIIVAYQTSTGTDAAFSGWTEGFGEVSDRATSTTLAIGVASKISTGAETAAPTVTQAGTITGHASMILLSIPGAHDTTIPAVSLKADGTAAAADPGAHNPGAWDVEDTLWIAVAGSGMTSGTGSWTGVASAPANYTDYVDTATVDNSTVGQVEAAVAFRQNAVASEDVGPFSVDVSNARNSAVVIAVRPAPAAVDVTVDPAVVTLVGVDPVAAGTGAAQLDNDVIDGGDIATPPVDIVDGGDTATPPTDVIDANLATVTAELTFTGVDVEFIGPVVVAADPAILTLTGVDAALASPLVVTVDPATLTLAGAGPLRWPRPAGWDTVTEYHVSNTTLTVNIPTGTDGRVVWDEVTHKRVTIIGGRNVYIVGAEIDVDATDANPDLQNAVWIHGQDADGTIWIEGLYAHSSASPTKLLNDGVKTFAGFSNYTIQNCRIQDLTGTQAGYHSDAYQLVAGCKTLRVDNVSCVGEFQCFMFNPETTGLGASGGWNETWFGRVDTHVIASGDATARSWNFITTNPDLDGPIHLGSELYVEARLSSSITSSIAPAANFDVTGTAPNQVATPNANWTITVDGVFKQQDGSIVYMPSPANGGNVGLGYDPDAMLAGTGAATITVDPAILTLTGVDTAFASGAAGLEVTADPAVLALVGVDAAVAGSGTVSIPADPAVLTLTGIDTPFASGAAGLEVTADPAVLTVAGTDSTLTASGAAPITADSATLTLTGIDAGIAGSGVAVVTIDVAALTLTGVTPTAGFIVPELLPGFAVAVADRRNEATVNDPLNVAMFNDNLVVVAVADPINRTVVVDEANMVDVSDVSNRLQVD